MIVPALALVLALPFAFAGSPAGTAGDGDGAAAGAVGIAPADPSRAASGATASGTDGPITTPGGPAEPAPEAREPAPAAVADELLVRFEDDVPEAEIDRINAALGVAVLDRMLGGRLLLVRVPDATALADVAARYEATAGVRFVERNTIQEAQPGGGE